MTLPRKLVDLEVEAVAAVDRPANKRRFLVIKRAEEGGETVPETVETANGHDRSLLRAAWNIIAKHLGLHETNGEGEETMSEQEKTLDAILEGVSEEVKAAVKAAFDEQEKKLGELQKQVEELSKKAQEQEAEEINKADLPEPVRKRLEELERKAQEAEQIAKAEREARVKAEIRKRAEGYAGVAEVDKIAKALYEAQEKVSPEFAQELEEILKAAQERIAKGDLFKEFGSNGKPLSGDPSEQFAELVKKVAEEENIPYDQAARKVAREHPDLVEAYDRSIPVAKE